MTRTRALAAATAVALTLPLAAPANAQAGIFELSSGSSLGSSKHDYWMDPNDPSIDVPAQTPLGSAYTGSAPLSIALGIAIPLVALQLLIDASPTLRQLVDDSAAFYGLDFLPGSSEGDRIFPVDVWLEQAKIMQARLAERTN